MQHNSCLICNSSKLKVLPNYFKDYLVKCQKCGFVFCKKAPSSEELEKFYSIHYGQGKLYLEFPFFEISFLTTVIRILNIR